MAVDTMRTIYTRIWPEFLNWWNPKNPSHAQGLSGDGQDVSTDSLILCKGSLTTSELKLLELTCECVVEDNKRRRRRKRMRHCCLRNKFSKRPCAQIALVHWLDAAQEEDEHAKQEQRRSRRKDGENERESRKNRKRQRQRKNGKKASQQEEEEEEEWVWNLPAHPMRVTSVQLSPANWIPHRQRVPAGHGWHVPSRPAWGAVYRSRTPIWPHGPSQPWPWFYAQRPAAHKDRMEAQTTNPAEAPIPRPLLLLLLHFPWPNSHHSTAAAASPQSYNDSFPKPPPKRKKKRRIELSRLLACCFLAALLQRHEEFLLSRSAHSSLIRSLARSQVCSSLSPHTARMRKKKRTRRAPIRIMRSKAALHGWDYVPHGWDYLLRGWYYLLSGWDHLLRGWETSKNHHSGVGQNFFILFYFFCPALWNPDDYRRRNGLVFEKAGEILHFLISGKPKFHCRMCLSKFTLVNSSAGLY